MPQSSADDRTALSPGPIASISDCRSYLEDIVEQISGPRVRRVVGTVFHDLLRLLECLSITEGHLRHVQTAEETLAFFQLIRDEGRSLIEFIRVDALSCEDIDGELADALDGLAFALSHDLRRVFEGEYESTADKSTYVILGRIHRAYDVLTNCLQQSTLSLAVVYNPTLSLTQLFCNSELRYRQSLKLCSDLKRLQGIGEAFVQGNVKSAELSEALEIFRRDSLEHLMYSDWPQIESFCERIKSSSDDSSVLVEVVHQFLCYLETLLRQVKMRAVLADESGSSDTDLSQIATSCHTESMPPYFDTNANWQVTALQV